MDARADLRLVEIRERTAAAGHQLRDNLRLHLSDRTEGRGLMALSATNAVAHVAPDPRATPSRIELRSMIVRRPLKAAARPAIGRATSSSASARGLSSSCMSVSHG